jgi:hypothetical protein
MIIEMGSSGASAKAVTTETAARAPQKTGVVEHEFGDIKLVPFDDTGGVKGIKWRLNPKPRFVPRISTGIESVDKLFGGGLSKGLNIFMGSGGSGKSLMAREISKNLKTLYFTCEVISDAPQNKDYPNVITVDYTQYMVKPYRAISELFTFAKELKPELIVIDSMTSFFSQSNKALPESDVREMVWKVHTACDGIIPIIGISEVRGQGFSRAPAGGQGVMHGCSLLVEFDRDTVKYQSHKDLYGAKYGDVIYTVQVIKDKGNRANIYPHRVKWSEKKGYDISKVEEK